MKAIIIAAGMGSRLGHYTDQRPKCMVEVNGRSILSFILEAFAANGVDDIHVVRGYLADRLRIDGATYWENPDYRDNNILLSLFCAQPAMDGPFLSTYSDIVFTSDVVARLLASPADIALVVDRDWATAYEGRADHPPEQAELALCDGTRVLQVGKHVTPEQQPLGEFIGLAKYSATGARLLREVYNDVRATHGDDEPFQAATLFRKAYLTDLFEELIARGVAVEAVPIDGGWREIDTIEDLERASKTWRAH